MRREIRLSLFLCFFLIFVMLSSPGKHQWGNGHEGATPKFTSEPESPKKDPGTPIIIFLKREIGCGISTCHHKRGAFRRAVFLPAAAYRGMADQLLSL